MTKDIHTCVRNLLGKWKILPATAPCNRCVRRDRILDTTHTNRSPADGGDAGIFTNSIINRLKDILNIRSPLTPPPPPLKRKRRKKSVSDHTWWQTEHWLGMTAHLGAFSNFGVRLKQERSPDFSTGLRQPPQLNLMKVERRDTSVMLSKLQR